MTTDPRLRLLGGDGAVASGLLGALDETHVVIRTGPDMAGAHTAALAAFVGMAARLFGMVSLDPPVVLTANWWNAPHTTDLLAALHRVRPKLAGRSSREVVVTFGDRLDAGDFGVGGDDYTVRLAREPQVLGPQPTHAFGVHAAACLAISQLLIDALGPHGFAGVAVAEPYVTNLIDYQLVAAPAPAAAVDADAARRDLRIAVAGVGSLGSSTLALLATALAPAFSAAAGHDLCTLAEVVTIDADTIDPGRNPFRYPALLGDETGNKADHFASRLAALGLAARSEPTSVAVWTRNRDRPGFDGLLISSVDTLEGRLHVADVLARSTLSVGVSGLSLHAQREGFADGFACPFCDYVSADPPLTQASVHAETTGLPIERILALLQDGARLTRSDVDLAIAAGRLPPQRCEALIGAPLSDLVRQAYAEIEVRAHGHPTPQDEVVTVAAPQVSWFAGVLAAVEVVKQLRGLPLVNRRVDADLSGLPPGLVRRVATDRTGRCLCRSGTRIRWYRKLYEDHTSDPPHPVPGVS